MSDYCDWKIYRCPDCGGLFAVPYFMTGQVDDGGEGYRKLDCPYCDTVCDCSENYVQNFDVKMTINKKVFFEIIEG